MPGAAQMSLCVLCGEATHPDVDLFIRSIIGTAATSEVLYANHCFLLYLCRFLFSFCLVLFFRIRRRDAYLCIKKKQNNVFVTHGLVLVLGLIRQRNNNQGGGGKGIKEVTQPLLPLWTTILVTPST
jgi:hypothetical protein